MTDKIKLALAFLLVAAGLGAFYFLAELALVLRILAVLAGVAAAIAVMWTSPLGQSAFAFSRESLAEARKVVWPTRKETVQTTGAVFALVVVMGLFLWLVDVGLMWFVQLLMGRSA
jgi:preprotein translocase subunit SecE